MKKKSALQKESKFGIAVLLILSIICILPLMMVISASLTDEKYLQANGYSLLPLDPSLDTYRFLIANRGKMILRAMILTVTVVIMGTVYSASIVTCFAYSVTQKKEVFRFTRILSFFAWFSTVFSGGVLPWYILCTQNYGLKNNIWALFIPYGMNVFNMFIIRGDFRRIPEEMFESAKLDGASHSQIFVKIAIPLARSGITTVILFNILTFWNDFYLPQWLITNSDYNTLQKLLYGMLSNVTALLKNSELSSVFANITLPTETAKMAVAVMTILPIMVLYPFALRYFVKGINVGGIKG